VFQNSHATVHVAMRRKNPGLPTWVVTIRASRSNLVLLAGVLVAVVLVGALSLGLPLMRETSRLLVALPEYLRLAAQELERLEAAWFPFLVSGEGGTARVVASFAAWPSRGV